MITPRQRQLLDYLIAYHGEHGLMPTYREICDGINLASISNVNGLMIRLEERGYVRRMPARPRAIELTAKARALSKTREELQIEVDRLRGELIRAQAKINFMCAVRAA